MRAVRRFAPHAVTVLLVLAVVEGAAFVTMTRFLAGSPATRLDLDAFGYPPSQEDVDAFRRWGWDRELGWLLRPNVSDERAAPGGGTWRYTIDARGARANPAGGAPGRVSAYGDSFTFGYEVNDDETWPYYLSTLTGLAVDNWGQSAWGPDQALLRLRRNLPAHRTDVVVLAVQSENVARLLNCYRPFLSRNEHMRLAFKPMLAWRDGALAWRPSPLARLETPEDFTRAFARARETDYWYARNAARPAAGFPYVASAFGALWCQIRACYREDLWADAGAVARLDFLVEDFAGLARAHDFVPVVLFIPEPRELRRFARGRTVRYRGYVARLRARRDLGRLRVVDVLDRPFDAPRFNLAPFKHHPSPYGQQVIAETLREALADLLAGTPPLGVSPGETAAHRK